MIGAIAVLGLGATQLLGDLTGSGSVMTGTGTIATDTGAILETESGAVVTQTGSGASSASGSFVTSPQPSPEGEGEPQVGSGSSISSETSASSESSTTSPQPSPEGEGALEAGSSSSSSAASVVAYPVAKGTLQSGTHPTFWVNSIGAMSLETLEGNVAVTLENGSGATIETFVRMTESGTGYLVQATPKESVTPGMYDATIVMTSGRKGLLKLVLGGEDEKTLWEGQLAVGMLLVNTEKETYAAGQTVNVQASFLDAQGKALCGKQMEAALRNAQGKVIERVSTKDDTVTTMKNCALRAAKAEADYAFAFNSLEAGTYTLTVAATDGNLQVVSGMDIAVENPAPLFSAKRESMTRTYEGKKDTVTITAFSEQDVIGELQDIVPNGFTVTDISAGGRIDRQGNVTVVSWKKLFAMGTPVTVDYTIKNDIQDTTVVSFGPIRFKGDISSTLDVTPIVEDASSTSSDSSASSEASSGVSSEDAGGSSSNPLTPTLSQGEREAPEGEGAPEVGSGSGSSFLGSLFGFMGSILHLNDDGKSLTFAQERGWDMVVQATEESKAQVIAKTDIVLEAKNENVIPQTQGAAFTLLHVDMEGEDMLDANGHLKMDKALGALVQATSDANALDTAIAKAVIASQSQSIAETVGKDSGAVNDIAKTLEEGSSRRQNEAVHEAVADAIGTNNGVQGDIANILADDLSPIVSSVLTDGMREDVMKGITEGQDVMDILEAQAPGITESLETIVKDAIDGKEGEIARAVAESRDGSSTLTMTRDSKLQAGVIPSVDEGDTGGIVTVTLTSKNGQVVTPSFHFEKGSVVLVVEPEQQFTPGVYTLTVTVTNPLTGESQTLEQDFAWGVLAINSHKDTYKKGEIMTLAMGVLNDYGDIVCNADLTLDVTAPSGEVTTLSTADGSIAITGTCGERDSMSISPDYETALTAAENGTYTLTLTATTDAGTREMTTRIKVQDSPAFQIERKAATRLYPFGPSPMEFTVTFHQNYSGTIKEVVPESFGVSSISPYASVSTTADGKVLTWNGSWNAGQTATFRYIYDAPDISPQFYLMGPITLKSVSSSVDENTYQEDRAWQIANDAATTYYWIGTNTVTADNWSDTTKWSTGTGGVACGCTPGSTSLAVFNSSGVGNVTLNATVNVQGMSIRTGYTGTITQASGITVTVGSDGYDQIAGTFTGGSDTIGITTFTLAGGIFTSTSGTLNIAQSLVASSVMWNHTAGGTFNHNNGLVKMGGGWGPASAIDVATSETFYDLEIDTAGSTVCGGGCSITVASGDSLIVTHTFTHTEGNLNTGTIEVRGNMVVGTLNPMSSVNTATISFLVAGDQTITGNGGVTGNLYINKPSGTVSAGSTDLYLRSFTLASGTFTSTSGILGLSYTTNTPANSWIHTAGGTFNHNNGTVKIGAGWNTEGIIDVATSETFYNLDFDAAGTYACGSSCQNAISSGDTLVVLNTFTQTDGRINTGTIEARGNVVIGASAGGGTAALTFSGTADQTYTDGGTEPTGKVTVNKASGTLSLAQNTSWNASSQDLHMSGGTLNMNGYNLTVNDVLTMSGGTLTQGTGTITTATYNQDGGTFTGGSGTIKINGVYTLSGGTFTSTTGTLQIGTNTAGANWTHTGGGTFNHNNGTVKYQGRNSTWDVSTSETFYNLNLSCGIDGNCDGSYLLTIASGDTLIVTNTFTHTDGAISTGTIEVQGNAIIASTADGGTATLSFLVGGDQTITGNGGSTFNLNVAKASGTLSAGSTNLIVKSFTLSSGIFLSTSGTFQIGNNSQDADWTHTAGGTFSHNNGTVKYQGAKSGGGVGGIWNVATSETFYNLTLSCGADGNCGGSHTMTISSGDSLIVMNTFTHSNGPINTGTIEAQGNVVIGAAANGGSAALTFSGTNNQIYTDNGGTKTTGTVTINKASGTVTLASAMSYNTSGQDLAITSGTLNLNGFNLTVNDQFTIASAGTLQLQGSETITGGPDTLSSGSTVEYIGTGAQTIKNLAYQNLKINGAGGTFSLPATTDVNGNLTISQGTLDATASNYNITLAGIWENEAGTFNGRAATVTLDGTGQTMSGSTTFYNLTKSVSATETLTFYRGTTQTVTGTMTMNGASGQRLSLRSSTTGTQFRLDPQGTRTVSYLDVKDANNINATAISCSTSCVSRGNNTNWTIPGSIVGTVYSDEGFTNIGASISVAVSIDGGAATSATTDSSGEYVFTDLSFTSGQVLTLFINGNGTTNNAVTVTTGADTNLSDVKLYKNNLIVRSGVTSANLATAKTSNSSDSDITQIFSMSSNNATVANGKKMYVWTGATLTLGGTLSVGSSGTTSELHLDGNLAQGNNAITVRGPYTQSGGTFVGGNAAITLSSFLSLENGAFNGGSAAVTVSGDIVQAGGTFTATSGTTSVGSGVASNWTVSGGTFDPSTGTVQIFTGNFQSFTITGNRLFNNLTIGISGGAGGSTVTIADGTTLTINGTLTAGYGLGALTINGGVIDAKGNVVQRQLGMSGTTSLIMSGTSDQTLTGGTANASLLAFTINKNSGILTLSGSIQTGKNWTHTAGVVDPATSTVQFFNGNSQTITVAGSQSFNNLTIGTTNHNGGGTLTLTDGTTLTVNGTLSYGCLSNAATVNGGTIEVHGNITQFTVGATGTTALNITGTGNQVIAAGHRIFGPTVTINKSSGTVTLSSALVLTTSGQDLALTAGTLNLNGYNLTVNDQFTIGASGILKLFGSETITGGPDTVTSGATTIFTGDGDGNADTYTPTSYFSGSFKNLTFAATDGALDTFQLGGTLTVPQALIISGSSVLSLNGNSLVNTSGTFANYGTLKLQGGETLTNVTNDVSHSGTVMYVGTSSYSSLPLGNTYHHLTFNGSGGSWTPTSTLTVAGNLTLAAGTLVAPSSITVTGTWENEGATFTKGTSTVILNGTNQTMSGSTTFYNLTKGVMSAATMTFTAGGTTTVTNRLSLSGATANALSLRSSSTGSQWNIDPQGTKLIGYLDVKDSNNANATAINCITDCVNSGNNTNWVFPVTGTVYTSAGSTVMGAGKTVAISVNGGTANTATTASDGTFVINPPAFSDGDMLAIYLDGNTEKGVTVTEGNQTVLSGFRIHQNALIVRNDNGGSTSNTEVAIAINNNDTDLTSIVSATGGTLTMVSGKTLLVPSSHTYAPGGTTNVDDIKIDGTFTMGSNAVAVAGDWDSGNGTFTGSNTVTFGGTGTIEKGSSSFNNITISESGLAAHWKFDETSGTTAADSSGNGYNGTLTNGPTISTDVPSALASADARSLSFDGVNDSVTTSSATGLPYGSSPRTVTLWVKTTWNGAHRTMFYYGTADAYKGVFFYVNGGKLNVDTYITNWNATTSINDGQWHHAAFTFDGGTTTRIYVDGVLDGTNTGQTFNTVLSAPVKIGDDFGRAFPGSLDDVRLYNRALSAGEIADLANGNNPSGTRTASGSITTTGNLTITNGTLKTNGSNLTVGGTFRNDATLRTRGSETLSLTNDTAHDGTVYFDGSASYSGLGGLTSFANLTLSGAGTWTLANDITTAGDVLLARGTLNQNGKAMTIGGNWTDTGTFAASGTTTFTGAGTITEPTQFGNLVVNATGNTVALGAPLTVSGSLTISAGTFDVSASNHALNLKGNLTNNGTFNARSGTVTLSGNDQAIGGSSNTTFYNLTKSVAAAKTLTFPSARVTTISHNTVLNGVDGQLLFLRSDVTGTKAQVHINPTGRTIQYVNVKDMHNTSGTVVACDTGCINALNNTGFAFPLNVTAYSDRGITNVGSNKTIALAINGQLNAPANTNVSGTATFTGADIQPGDVLTFWFGGGTMTGATVDVTDAQNISFPLYANTLRIQHETGASITNTHLATAEFAHAGLTSVYGVTAGDLTMNNGYALFIPSSATFAPGGDVNADDLRNEGTLAMGSDALELTGSLNNRKTLTTSGTVTFSGSDDATLTSSGSVFTDVVVNKDAGTVAMADDTDITGDLTITSGTLGVDGNVLAVDGTYANDGTVRLDGDEDTSGFAQDADSGTTEFAGEGTYSGLAGLTAFKNLAFDGDGSWELDAPVTVNGDFLLAAGTVDQNAQGITVYEDWNNTGTFVADGTVTFAGTGTVESDDAFGSVTVNAPAGTVTQSGALTVAGNLLLRNGTLSQGTSTGNILNVAGTWEKEAAGTLSAGQGTVNLNSGGSQTLSGSTTFWNLKKTVSSGSTLTFNRGTTQTISGTWTAKGTAGNVLRLRSSVTGQQWNVDPESYDLQYIDVRDSNNTSGDTILAANDATNGGNNTGWAFPIAVTVVSKEGAALGAGITVTGMVGSGAIVTSTTNSFGIATFNDGDEDHTMSGVASGALLTFTARSGTGVGVVIDRSNGTTLAFTIRMNTLSIRNEVGSGVTNGDLTTALNADTSGNVDDLYTMSGSTLIGANEKTLRIESGSTYRPGGNVNADDFRIAGTFAMGNNEVTVRGSWDAAGGTFSGTNTVIFTSQETETITVNTSAFHNVIFVVGTDPNKQIGKWTTTDNFNVSGSQTIQNTTNTDFVAPVISAVEADPVYDILALVKWLTNESADSIVRYGTDAGNLNQMGTGSGTGLAHAVALQNLEPETTYHYRVYSTDLSGNTATGSVLTFTTIPKLSTKAEVAEREAAALAAGIEQGYATATAAQPERSGGGGGGGSTRTKCGTAALTMSDVTAENAKDGTTRITWTTNYEALTLTQYGKESIEEKAAINMTDYVKEHSLTLAGLSPATAYTLVATSIDKCGTLVTSEPLTFTSDSDANADLLDEITHEAADDKSILEKALGILRNLTDTMSIPEAEKTLLAQADTIKDLANRLPGPLLSGEPRVTVTDSSATISWTSDKESNSLVSYSPADKYKVGQYLSTVGNPEASTTGHQVTLVELSPGKTYHFSVKSTTKIGTETASADYTFTTLAQTPEVKTYTIDTLSPSSASVAWQTSVIADGQVRFTPYSNGRLSDADSIVKFASDMAYAHKVTTNDLESGTVYQVEITGKTAGGVTVSKIIPSFATSAQSLAPQLAEIQTDASLSPGKETRIQVIISWKTDKRGTSKVRYQKGVSAEAGAVLSEETPTDESKSNKHAVILAGLEPGTVYSFQVESGDDQGHVTTSKIFTILTPKKQESVFQVITSEFGKAFGWLGDL